MGLEQQEEKQQEEDEPFITRIGKLQIDWPRSLGYFGAVWAAVALDMIAPPIGVFITAIPLVKLFKRKNATKIERFVAAIVEGAGKPVGGDCEGTVRMADDDDAGAPQIVVVGEFAPAEVHGADRGGSAGSPRRGAEPPDGRATRP